MPQECSGLMMTTWKSSQDPCPQRRAPQCSQLSLLPSSKENYFRAIDPSKRPQRQTSAQLRYEQHIATMSFSTGIGLTRSSQGTAINYRQDFVNAAFMASLGSRESSGGGEVEIRPCSLNLLFWPDLETCFPVIIPWEDAFVYSHSCLVPTVWVEDTTALYKATGKRQDERAWLHSR